MAHGKLTIGALLYSLNIGPFTYCPFCGLEEKTAEHLIWKCNKVSHCWHIIHSMFDILPNDINNLHSGNWLFFNFNSRTSTSWAKAIIASISWFSGKKYAILSLRRLNPDLMLLFQKLSLIVQTSSELSEKFTGSILKLQINWIQSLCSQTLFGILIILSQIWVSLLYLILVWSCS